MECPIKLSVQPTNRHHYIQVGVGVGESLPSNNPWSLQMKLGPFIRLSRSRIELLEVVVRVLVLVLVLG